MVVKLLVLSSEKCKLNKCAWKKFKELSPILTFRRVLLKLKGKFYGSCVQSCMMYESETWPMKKVHEINQCWGEQRCEWLGGCAILL